MTVDENFGRVILRNPRKITEKNHPKTARLTSLGSNLSHSPTDHSKDAKKRLEDDTVTWVNETVFSG